MSDSCDSIQQITAEALGNGSRELRRHCLHHLKCTHKHARTHACTHARTYLSTSDGRASAASASPAVAEASQELILLRPGAHRTHLKQQTNCQCRSFLSLEMSAVFYTLNLHHQCPSSILPYLPHGCVRFTDSVSQGHPPIIILSYIMYYYIFPLFF